MHRTIGLLILLGGLLGGCSPQKNALQSSLQTDLQEEQSSETTQHRQQTSTTANDTLHTDHQQDLQIQDLCSEEWWQLHLKLYDTTQPPDSLLGQRPLLADVTLYRGDRTSAQNHRQTLQSETAQHSTLHTDRQNDSLITLQQQQTDLTVHQQHQEQQRTARRIPLSVWLLGFATLSWLLYRLFRSAHNN